MSKSIVTFQLGNYANFIGAHFWNIHELQLNNRKEYQKYYKSDIFYFDYSNDNDGKEAGPTNYLPKLICWDWKQNLGGKIIDNIHEDSNISHFQSKQHLDKLVGSSFSGDTKVYSGFTDNELFNKNPSLPENKTDYQEWNEFLIGKYHPKSIYRLPKLYRNNDSSNFKTFGQGQDLLGNSEMLEQISEQTRYFVEKCESIQGFQLLSDFDGFCGVSMNLLEYLNDEYHRDSIVYPCIDDIDDLTSNQELLFNIIAASNSFNSNSLFWSPLNITQDVEFNQKRPNNYFNIPAKSSSKYLNSSILAMAINSTTVPLTRTNEFNYHLTDYHSLFSYRTSKMASLAMSLSFPQHDESLCEFVLNNKSAGALFDSLNPFCSSFTDPESIIGSLVGSYEHKDDPNLIINTPFKYCTTASEFMEVFMQSSFNPENCRIFHMPRSYQLVKPYFPIESMNSNLASVLFTNSINHCFVQLHEAAQNILQRRRNMSTALLNIEFDVLKENVNNFCDLI